MKLTELRPGETGVVSQVNCGRGAKKKLSSRGIKRGSRIRMVSSSRGPVVVESRDSRMAIGRGMARRIEVVRK